MALPNGFRTYNTYFHEAVSFLNDHSFLYKYANTEILSKEILKRLPENWTQCIENLSINEIAALPYSKCDIFDNFFAKLGNLSPILEECNGERCGFDFGKNQKRIKGLSPKKQHEISELSEEIHKQCVTKGVNLIIDLGSGLGYLSQLLFEKYGHNVIGIEGNIKNVEQACKRQENLFENSKNNVKYVQHYITANSADEIKVFCNELFSRETGFLIVGLHACADLTINAIKLFLDIDSCRGIFIMPCCYHKMHLKSDDHFKNGDSFKMHNMTKVEIDHNFEYTEYKAENSVKGFENECTAFREKLPQFVDMKSLSQEFDCFPLSVSLTECFRRFKAEIFLQRPFLRLGCQRTQTSWKCYEKRVFHLLSRAVLELYAFKENARLTKTKQRGVRRVESNKCDFSSFLEDAIGRGYVLEKPIIEVTQSQKHYKQIILTECSPNGQIANENIENVDDLFKKQGIDLETLSPEGYDKHLTKIDALSSERIQSKNIETLKSPQFENNTSLKSEIRKTEDCKRVLLDFDRIEINKLWNDLSEADFKAAALFIVLQDSLQGLCENIILVDKLAFVSEIKRDIVQDFRFVKVTDDKISPRCLAFVASKR